MKPERTIGDAIFTIAVLILTAACNNLCAGEIGSCSCKASAPLEVQHPLVAWWQFDEVNGDRCADATGHSNDAAMAGRNQDALRRIKGLYGQALSFSGEHQLEVPRKPDFSGLKKLSFSVWVRPTRLDGYNEIFRKEDGENRVLFSFQENGTVLSLGLNVGNYAECDARIDPAEVLDGQWHHCAATFDGQWMRVYLDGGEIGSMRRSGTFIAKGGAPGCIGSSGGGECFQGAMDDFRIYADALTADEVRAVYRGAQPILEEYTRQIEQRIAGVYVAGQSFAETLSSTRRNIAERGIRLDNESAAAVIVRIKTAYPREYADFLRHTGLKLVDYLVATNNDYNLHTAERLFELLVEYKPLTEEQWRNQTPEDLKKWREIETLEQRWASLKAQGAAAQFSPAWINLMLEAGRRIQLRPYVQEAVAPYVRPSTPATRDLTAAEAREALERDWLFQADQNPTPQRIQNEIQWALQQAAQISSQYPGRVDFAKELAGLGTLEQKAARLGGPDRDLYFQVRAIKRQIMFKNPAVDFDRVLFVDMPFPQGSESAHETRHRLGYMAVPGARLLVLTGLSPSGHLFQLMPQAPLHGSFWRPDLSYDARRVVFCFKPHNEKSFHLYEINVDGSGLVQLTDGPYDDLDPVYLPDGEHIVFSTTRGHTYVRCMPPTSAFVLARCDRQGKHMYFISSNNEPDYLPSVMSDGRVVYTRWEYTDKPLWRAEKLWTVHPDGTQVNMLWGNQSVWPDLLKDARSIPGSPRVMFTGSAHHNWFAGSVGILDPQAGLNFPDGLTKVTADVPWPECGNGPVDPVESPRYHRSGNYTAYYSPYPLSEHDFIVSANRGGKFMLYLMDADGDRELIYEGVNNIFHALPLKARPKPPVIPDQVDWPALADKDSPPEDGVFYSSDIYKGAPEVLRGKAKYLRVLTIDYKTYTYWHLRPYISTGPVVSGVQSDGVKRILGTVAIEADGSVAFRAPAGVPLHFQLLDEKQRALQTMRSFANLMPGEKRGCLGCHELHSRTPEAAFACLALKKAPHPITPPPWSDTSVSYARYVRPVLDKYCSQCHTGNGEGRKTLDLTARPEFLGFDASYWLLTGHPSWGEPYHAPKDPPPGWGIADTIMVEAYSTVDPAAYVTPAPMTTLSYKSRLIELASSGRHHNVKVDPISLLRLKIWIDTMCPYRGDEEIRQIPDPEFQGVDWLAVRPKIKTAPRPVRPGPLG
ncbi:MAG: hypothetical protein M1608_11595 [Candidatus Omnitrophica bacterium]|nr:hypothetical protein [Candidatus Omnitrophota bacterium]